MNKETITTTTTTTTRAQKIPKQLINQNQYATFSNNNNMGDDSEGNMSSDKQEGVVNTVYCFAKSQSAATPNTREVVGGGGGKVLMQSNASIIDKKQKQLNEIVNPSPGRRSMFYTQSHNASSKRRNNSSSPGGQKIGPEPSNSELLIMKAKNLKESLRKNNNTSSGSNTGKYQSYRSRPPGLTLQDLETSDVLQDDIVNQKSKNSTQQNWGFGSQKISVKNKSSKESAIFQKLVEEINNNNHNNKQLENNSCQSRINQINRNQEPSKTEELYDIPLPTIPKFESSIGQKKEEVNSSTLNQIQKIKKLHGRGSSQQHQKDWKPVRVDVKLDQLQDQQKSGNQMRESTTGMTYSHPTRNASPKPDLSELMLLEPNQPFRMSNIVKGVDDKQKQQQRDSSINQRGTKSARGYQFIRFKKEDQVSKKNSKQSGGKNAIPQKKITVSDAMKPNSYAFSKKSSVPNALHTRSTQNSSPLDRGLTNKFAKKQKNPLPKKKSINLVKSNNNNQNSTKHQAQSKTQTKSPNKLKTKRQGRSIQTSPFKQNLQQDYIYGTQKKFFPFNPVYTPSSTTSSSQAHKAVNSGVTSQTHSKFEKNKYQIKSANIDLKRRVQWPKKEEKIQTNINISPKKYTYNQSPAYYNQPYFQVQPPPRLQYEKQPELEDIITCNNNNIQEKDIENNNSFTQGKKTFLAVTPQSFAKSSQNSTIPHSPHQLKTLTPAQKDVMNKYLTGNRNLQLGFQKFQKRQQFFQIATAEEKKQFTPSPPKRNNNDRESLPYNFGFDVKSKIDREQQRLHVYRNEQDLYYNNSSNNNNNNNNNNNYNNNFNNYQIEALQQQQQHTKPKRSNQIDLDEQRMQQKLDQMLQSTRKMMMYQ